MSWLEWGTLFALLVTCMYPLGVYIGKILQGESTFLHPVLRPLEKLFYKLMRIHPHVEMDWKQYTAAFLIFNFLGEIILYAIMRLQGVLPFNPQGFSQVEPFLAFNTAISFITNTNWQNYAGESTLSYFSQMVGLTPQNFLSASSGIAIFAALTRGISRRESQHIGNFWIDLIRSVIYILLPLAFIFSLVFVWQGVPQTLETYPKAEWLEPNSSKEASYQEIAVGPVASQEAIKMLGTNGGGFFNVNSAHPFENPTPLTNFLEIFAMLLIPVSLTLTYGYMIKDLKQGYAILIAMTAIYIPLLLLCYYFESTPHPQFEEMGITQERIYRNPGGNMEGKEMRNGISGSVLWAVSTTATSNGGVNSMHDSYFPLSGLILMGLMKIGEVVYGGVGSGIYGMIAYIFVAVFIAGLMVGRTPEYFGKKVESYEIKMASLILLFPILLVLGGTSLAILYVPDNAKALNPGPHAFSEVLYAFTSAGNNNGSAFAGLDGNNPFYNIALGIVMFMGRFIPGICAIAIAGSMAAKKSIPLSSGSLPTYTPLFIVWLIGIILIIGALAYMPALALGPIVEYLLLER